ncbi:hypothetical protein D3C75_719190 [compost metagenome]
MVIFPNHIGHNGDHSEIPEAMLFVMLDAIRMEVFHGGHAISGCVSEQYTVLDMDSCHSPRPQDTQELRGEKIHLLKKTDRIFVMAEIVITWRIFVVIGKRYGGMDEINRILRHTSRLQHTIIVHNGIKVFLDFHALHSYGTGQFVDD